MISLSGDSVSGQKIIILANPNHFHRSNAVVTTFLEIILSYIVMLRLLDRGANP